MNEGKITVNDAAIIELFWARSEDAIKQTDEKYGKLCRRLSNNILNNDSDAEECVNDTYLRVWNLIPDERPSYFQAFLCKLVKNISLDRLKFKTAKKRDAGGLACLDELEECVAAPAAEPEAALEANDLSRAVSDFLRGQSDYVRRIFVRRYWYCDALKDIAADYGVKEQKISAQLFRTRAKLRDYLIREGFSI